MDYATWRGRQVWHSRYSRPVYIVLCCSRRLTGEAATKDPKAKNTRKKGDGCSKMPYDDTHDIYGYNKEYSFTSISVAMTRLQEYGDVQKMEFNITNLCKRHSCPCALADLFIMFNIQILRSRLFERQQASCLGQWQCLQG